MCAQYNVQRRALRVSGFGRMYEELPMGRKIMIFSTSVWRPPTDVFETDSEFVIRSEISGLRKTPNGEIENAQVLVHGDMITIRGNRADDCALARSRVHQMEIQYGAFEVRVSFQTPFNTDAIKSSYRDGFLEVVVPKAKKAKQAVNQIKVRT